MLFYLYWYCCYINFPISPTKGGGKKGQILNFEGFTHLGLCDKYFQKWKMHGSVAKYF